MSIRNCVVPFVVMLVAGCESAPELSPAPRPVSVLRLAETDPGRFERITGAVVSWKTDKLGFEVDGRVQFVIEPETEIAGQVFDRSGSAVTKGTELARLDSTRYELSLDSSKAQVVVAEKQLKAAQIEFEQVIPAQQKASTARRDLAQADVTRNRPLVASNTITRAQFDIYISTLQESEAELIELAAGREAKAAEVESIEAKISELQEAVRQAKRDLDDCRLFSSFPGQVAEIHVIPGSVVKQGQPAVTVQAMDPIKVEFEVSAATARRLNHRDQVTVHVPQPDGKTMRTMAFIYMIDPLADPLTRTFTVTLTMRNDKIRVPMPEELKGQSIARASFIGKAIYDIPGVTKGLFLNEAMLQSDAEGSFVWKILNRRVGTLSKSSDSVLRVQRVRVTPGELQLSFLGIASMHQISIAENAEFDPKFDMIAGDVTLPDGMTTWSGDRMLFDRPRWLVRPGDLVGVDLASEVVKPGIYIPLDAIMEQSGANFVFAVAESPEGDSARRVEVTAHETVGTLRRIEVAATEKLPVGARIVASGAAFLADGERINVAREVELGR